MRRAVRSVAVLLCVLAAYVVLSDMKLTPRAAIRMGEQYYGIYEPTRTVAMQRMRIGWQNYRVYLTAGENSLYCGAARLTPSGWDIIFMGDAISCADGESVHVGNWCPGSLNKIIGQEIIFGRVDDPNIALLTIEEWGGRDWTKPGARMKNSAGCVPSRWKNSSRTAAAAISFLTRVSARKIQDPMRRKRAFCILRAAMPCTGKFCAGKLRSAQTASYKRGAGARQLCRAPFASMQGGRGMNFR